MRTILALLIANAKAGLPPTSEKSFYSDLRKGSNGMHYADMLGGELKEDLDVWYSTSENRLGIFTDECPHYTCEVSPRWNPHDSKTKTVVSETEIDDTCFIPKEAKEGAKI